MSDAHRPAHARKLERVEEWKRRLVDLSRRNRLLYNKPTKRQSLDILEPEAQTVVGRLGGRGGWRFYVPPDPDTGADDLQLDAAEELMATTVIQADELWTAAPSARELQRTLENLYRRSTSDLQERGVQVLQVAVGTLVWTDPERNEQVRSPLILIPATLERAGIGQPFVLRRYEDEAVVNPTLSVKLDRDFGVSLPEIEGTLEDDDDDDYDLGTFLDRVAALHPDWRVERTCQLGLFTFFKEVIFRDLAANAGVALEHSLVGALAGGTAPARDSGYEPPSEDELDTVQSVGSSFEVLSADSSQRLCLEAARRGGSFVIQGPPGTGKSQTIANLIAQAIGTGQSVLFVSEKMAALEVVQKRLAEVDLDQFCLEVHSHKANKKQVTEQLFQALNHRVEQRRGMSADELDRLQQTLHRLNDYVHALHEVREPASRSAYQALGVIASLPEAPVLTSPSIAADTAESRHLNEITEESRRLASGWQQVVIESDFPWRGYTGEQWDLATRQTILDALAAADRAMGALQEAAAEYAAAVGLAAPMNPAGAIALSHRARLVDQARPVPAGWLGEADLEELTSLLTSRREAAANLRAARELLTPLYPSIPEPTVADAFESSLTALETFTGSSSAELEAQRGVISQVSAFLARHAAEWQQAATQIGRALGWPPERLRLADVDRILAAGRAVSGSIRPPASWLSPANLRDTQELFGRLRLEVAQAQTNRRRLGDRYTDGFIALGEISDRYHTDAAKPFARLRGRHRADRASVRALTRSRSLEPTVLDDLKHAKSILDAEAAIAKVAPDAERLLDSLFQGADTDNGRVDAMFEAIGVLSESLPDGTDYDELAATLRDGASVECQRAVALLDRTLRDWQELAVGLEGGPKTIIGSVPLVGLSEFADSLATKVLDLDRDRAELEGRRVGAANLAALREESKQIQVLAVLGHRFASSTTPTRFPGFDLGPDGEWDKAAHALRWAAEIESAFADDISPTVARILVAEGFVPPSHAALDQATSEAATATNEIAGWFDPEEADEILVPPLAENTHSFSDVAAALSRLRGAIDDLAMLVNHLQARWRLYELGWGDFVRRLIDIRPAPDVVIPAFVAAYHRGWVEDVFEHDPRLKRFRGEDHEALIDEFRRLDDKLAVHAREEVIRQANERRPRDFGLPDNQVSVVRKEGTKRKRHKPIRRLFAEIPELVVRLKPCLMMSPLSVSQFLPSTMQFDLVIFDEASQVTVEDAVCALYRSKRQVVAGDSKQLPPTRFFVADDDEGDEDEEDPEAAWESILERASAAGMPEMNLRWHYRSRHEGLIAYSNKAFYRGDLVTFPAAYTEHPALGVEFRHVADGVYDRGLSQTNRREVEEVVRAVFDQLARYPSKSLGVVTFNQRQMTAVQDAIDHYRFEHREFEEQFTDDRLDGFFVKNLENVQGDERDVMIFSTTYGRDPAGVFSKNFGPINKDGGERRLNVAITRAREKVIVISSMRASDFGIGDELRPGPHNLRNYLEYAELGPKVLRADLDTSGGDFESDFERAVAGVIREWGYEVVPQVGVGHFRIDLGVIDPLDPGRFLVGVECDGYAYHSAKTARDRDRLRQMILESLGWRITRVWSPDWNAMHDVAVKKLQDAIEAAGAGSAVRADADLEERPIESTRRGSVPVAENGEPARIPEIAHLYRYGAPATPAEIARSEINEVAVAIVRHSIGIEYEELIRQTARVLGYARTGSRIHDHIHFTLQELERHGQIGIDDDEVTLGPGA